MRPETSHVQDILVVKDDPLNSESEK